MKNILIINLRRLGDVYTTGHLVNSLTAVEGNNVSLLVYKESSKAADHLSNLTALHTIDRKEIITLMNNKLFSDGFAPEQLFNQLAGIKNQKWDEIINYSNDLVGAYLCSYLKSSAKNVVGVHFNGQRNVVTQNDWEILFNDVLPVVKYAPLHFVDCYHKMIGVESVREGEKIITNTQYNTTAFANMNTLRKTQGNGEAVAKIIAIQLKTADISKDIPEETLVELLGLLKKNQELVPVLMIAPIDEERRYAADINEKYNNEIVVVEADLEAVPSVLMNVDLLITPDTAIKHIADLCETPVLEISLGFAPFLKQGTYQAGNLILSDIIVERNFSQTGEHKKSKITAQDILATTLFFFSKSKTIRPRLSKDVTLYSCSFDNLGVRYAVAAGSVDASTEIHRLMSRQLLNVVYDQNESEDIYNDITDFGLSAAGTFGTKEKANVTVVMKDLLGTLRSLLQSVENRKSSREFITNLGKLIAHAEVNSLVQIPVTMFKTKIESINAKTFEENAKEVEVLLYELKSDIQKVLHCIKQLEEKVSALRKVDFASGKSNEQING